MKQNLHVNWIDNRKGSGAQMPIPHSTPSYLNAFLSNLVWWLNINTGAFVSTTHSKTTHTNISQIFSNTQIRSVARDIFASTMYTLTIHYYTCACIVNITQNMHIYISLLVCSLQRHFYEKSLYMRHNFHANLDDVYAHICSQSSEITFNLIRATLNETMTRLY